jgi:hypothetical protein
MMMENQGYARHDGLFADDAKIVAGIDSKENLDIKQADTQDAFTCGFEPC